MDSDPCPGLTAELAGMPPLLGPSPFEQALPRHTTCHTSAGARRPGLGTAAPSSPPATRVGDLPCMQPAEPVGIEPYPVVHEILLESTQAIPRKISWPAPRSPIADSRIEQLLDGEPSGRKAIEDWAARTRPNERAWAVDFCGPQSRSPATATGRTVALTKDGCYVWTRRSKTT